MTNDEKQELARRVGDFWDDKYGGCFIFNNDPESAASVYAYADAVLNWNQTLEYNTISRLRGEQSVLVTLLREAFAVIETIDGEGMEGSWRLMKLQNAIRAAVNGAMK